MKTTRANKEITVLIPVFNAETVINELIKNLVRAVRNITRKYEIILVDDFSEDNSWQNIKKISKKNSNIHGCKLYKNLGVDLAITEGLKLSKGNFVFIMTCDMTDPINQIKPMYDKIKKSKVDVVCAHYKNKHPESFFSKLFSSIYWKVFSFLIGEKYPVEEGLYRILSKKAVSSYLANKNKFKHIKITHTLGLRKDFIEMDQGLRKYGKSGFNLRKKIEFAIDYITTYSYKPLLYSSMLGLSLSVIFVLIGSLTIIFKLMGYINVPGWSSIIVFSSFISAIIFLNLAIIGIYLSRNIEETKHSNSINIMEKV